jgi:pimeloyl-ACP methyl ester carboxylesterase
MQFSLHHQLLIADKPAGGARPNAWMFLLHGIFGRGHNLRSLAARLVARRPEWGMVMIDLREHGRSQNAEPPHSLLTCAQDLITLAEILGADEKPVRAVAGHSFGGKVALAFRAHGPALLQTWVLDSSPGARPQAMSEPDWAALALSTMEALPSTWANREQFVTALVQRGFAAAVAQWLATNLEYSAAQSDYRLGLDLHSLRSLLVDYYASDLWSAITDESVSGEVQVVAAGRSDALSREDLARLERLDHDGVPVHLHRIAKASHWLHVDALDELVDLMAPALPAI